MPLGAVLTIAVVALGSAGAGAWKVYEYTHPPITQAQAEAMLLDSFAVDHGCSTPVKSTGLPGAFAVACNITPGRGVAGILTDQDEATRLAALARVQDTAARTGRSRVLGTVPDWRSTGRSLTVLSLES